MLGIVFGAIGLVLALAWLFPRSPAGRLVRALLAAAGLKVRRLEESQALGLYDQALERQGQALREGVDGLGEFRAVIESLGRQARHTAENAGRLESKLDAMDARGVPDTDPEKLRVAGQLATWRGRAADLEARLAEKRAASDRGMAGLRLAAAKLHEGRQGREFLAADLEAADADAKVADVLAAFSGGLDGAAGEMSEARERLERQIDRRKAHSAVLAEVGGLGDAIEADRLMADAAGADVLAARRAKAAN